MNNDITPETIKAVLDALVSTTSAQADTYLDDESQANVPKFEAVCDWVFNRLCNAYRYYDSPYSSAKQTARMVMNAAGDLAWCFTFDIDDYYNWALSGMEGCDEPEFTMYDRIVGAIEDYKRECKSRNEG